MQRKSNIRQNREYRIRQFHLHHNRLPAEFAILVVIQKHENEKLPKKFYLPKEMLDFHTESSSVAFECGIYLYLSKRASAFVERKQERPFDERENVKSDSRHTQTQPLACMRTTRLPHPSGACMWRTTATEN